MMRAYLIMDLESSSAGKKSSQLLTVVFTVLGYSGLWVTICPQETRGSAFGERFGMLISNDKRAVNHQSIVSSTLLLPTPPLDFLSWALEGL